ncbi:beta-glucosidase [Candidatus Moduliflexus flocculans]|uniref:Beta-glucosidase n=1 Tax=Candidatus Moduliflexus flocculans TaxID=1499966 RepID=A0A081BLU3_9BACT|nr:beta-glucosidase [Candidatus Moduliflexus flocculans]
MNFPENFVWGVAAAAYQIEGAAYDEGKGLSVWDMFCRKPGAVWNGHTGDVACDHYHRYQEDVALMKELGLPAYRLSVSWPRVLPQGVGAVNEKGLDFYDRLIDELLAANITPYVTLFHWDYPLELFRRGGWLNPDSPEWFADYTRLMVERLSDRVRHWMTYNEPRVFVGLGHEIGRHAPGLQFGLPDVLQMCHHVMLSHGRGVQTIRAYSKTPSQVGCVVTTGFQQMPATNRPEDIEAAREAMFSISTPNCFHTALWLDPILLGRYPDTAYSTYGDAMPVIHDGDLATMHQPLDFIGLNIYFGEQYAAGSDGRPEKVPFPAGHPQTAFRWFVTPEALYWGPKFVYERYGVPVMITENGLSNLDWVSTDGKVHDPQRIDFLRRYLIELRRACADGVDVRGYFQWSILDNFEWAEGYKERFGLVHVDYQTQKRTPKDSAFWYKSIIASNGRALDEI